jgi:hypothetical protein
MNDVFIHEARMPYSVRAMVMLDRENGDYVIYVNDYLSEEARLRAIEHEKMHIKRGDLHSQETAINIEKAMKK